MNPHPEAATGRLRLAQTVEPRHIALGGLVGQSVLAVAYHGLLGDRLPLPPSMVVNSSWKPLVLAGQFKM